MCEHRGDAVMSVKKSNRAAALFHRVLEGQYIIKNVVLISAGSWWAPPSAGAG